MDKADLARIERWMQAVIVHPHGADAGLSSAGAVAELSVDEAERLIVRKRGLSPADRLAIYADMYPIRMREALEADYPGLRAALGPRKFERLVHDYVERFPSRSWTLNRLGDHLPEFLALRRGERRGGALHDLSRLELAMTEAFDAEEAPSLDGSAFAAIPTEAFEKIRLRPVPSLRLLALTTPADEWLDSLREETEPPSLRRGAVWLLVHRREFRLHRRRLPAAEHFLLAELVAARTVGEALDRLTARRDAPDASVVSGWFARWAAEGIFRALDPTPGEKRKKR